MKIHFNGAARTVTGSQYLIEVNEQSLLLECGLFQGKRQESYTRNQEFRFPVKNVDAVILSHAHLDHCGNLPNLVARGYEKPIYATPATAEIADLVVRDSGHIQESDILFVNKKRAKRGEPPMKPLYTIADAEKVKPLFHKVQYNQQFEPINGVTARLVDAGHILGSAAVVLDINEKGRKLRLWFSGDIGRRGLPLLRDPVLPEEPDLLIMESTYGNKAHRDPELAYEEFRQVLQRTIQRRGKTIIPAFAIGRTQELVYFLNRMVTQREIPRIPVYVDSPLAVETTQVFFRFPQLFDDETVRFIQQGKHDALNFPGLRYTESADESRKLNDDHDPMVIISASGMAESGRILHHLRNNIENPRNTVVIVSWQAPDTLGRRLAERQHEVKIFGELFDLRAEVATIGGLSAHAGQDFLLEYARTAKGKLKRLFLVHGEQEQAGTLREKLEAENIGPISWPDLYETFEI